MKIAEFMNKRVEWIDSQATIYDAIERLVDLHIRSLVVKPEEPDSPPGVITARDIVYKVLGAGRNPQDVKVKDVAHFPIICVNKDENIRTVIEIMKTQNVARVFVCDGSSIIGVAALMDVMEASLIERAKGNSDAEKNFS